MTSTDRWAVLAPVGVRTGGPEALYQLTDSLRRAGAEAYLCNPFPAAGEPVPEYSAYDASEMPFADLRRTDVAVLPEKYLSLLPSLPCDRVVIWWLSVDNAFGAFGGRRGDGVVKRASPKTFVQVTRARTMRHVRRFEHRLTHCAQSLYALNFLIAQGVAAPRMLTDYLSSDFLLSEEDIASTRRDVALAYNPKKSSSVIESLQLAGDTPPLTPIQDLDRAGVVALLRRSNIYLDFGPHPGRDRVPREAAMAGAVVLVGTNGSAANNVDVPLPNRYKFDDDGVDHTSRLRQAIADILADPAKHQAGQSGYRAGIRQQRAAFDVEVQQVLAAAGA